LPLSLWVLVEMIFCVLMMMLEGIQNPGVRIQNLGGHFACLFTIPRETQANGGADQVRVADSAVKTLTSTSSRRSSPGSKVKGCSAE
jgi:hypothetical protein